MKHHIFLALFAMVAVTIFTAVAAEKDSEKTSSAPQPVDDDMHHLMEYVFEPAWKRLRLTMASEPADKKAWSAVKGDALTLAEVTNLLLHRLPEEKEADSLKLTVETRAAGSDFYQAARKRDFASATKSYKLMLNKCNACHDAFADGEHQLEP